MTVGNVSASFSTSALLPPWSDACSCLQRSRAPTTGASTRSRFTSVSSPLLALNASDRSRASSTSNVTAKARTPSEARPADPGTALSLRARVSAARPASMFRRSNILNESRYVLLLLFSRHELTHSRTHRSHGSRRKRCNISQTGARLKQPACPMHADRFKLAPVSRRGLLHCLWLGIGRVRLPARRWWLPLLV